MAPRKSQFKTDREVTGDGWLLLPLGAKAPNEKV